MKKNICFRDTGTHFILIYTCIKNKCKFSRIILIEKWQRRGIQHVVKNMQ